MREIPCIYAFFMIKFKGRKKTRATIPVKVPKFSKKTGFIGHERRGSKKPNGGKKHERYFNEATFRSRCSFRTSDKKMES